MGKMKRGLRRHWETAKKTILSRKKSMQQLIDLKHALPKQRYRLQLTNLIVKDLL